MELLLQKVLRNLQYYLWGLLSFFDVQVESAIEMSVGGREGRKALKGDVGGVIFFNVGKYGFGGESDTIEGNFGIELIESSFDF